MTRTTEKRILAWLRANEPTLLLARTSKYLAWHLARKALNLNLSFPAFFRVTQYALTVGALNRWQGTRTKGPGDPLLFTYDGRAAV